MEKKEQHNFVLIAIVAIVAIIAIVVLVTKYHNQGEQVYGESFYGGYLLTRGSTNEKECMGINCGEKYICCRDKSGEIASTCCTKYNKCCQTKIGQDYTPPLRTICAELGQKCSPPPCCEGLTCIRYTSNQTACQR